MILNRSELGVGHAFRMVLEVGEAFQRVLPAEIPEAIVKAHRDWMETNDCPMVVTFAPVVLSGPGHPCFPGVLITGFSNTPEDLVAPDEKRALDRVESLARYLIETLGVAAVVFTVGGKSVHLSRA